MNIHEATMKAAKLLRLANSSNQHEAALAAARAQEIIDRYKLDIDGLTNEHEVESAEPVRDYGCDDPIDNDARDLWKGVLLVVLCDVNDCKAYKSGPRLCIIGRPGDVQTVRYMYGFITRQVELFAARDCRGHSRTYWNNFRHGMVDTISRRLKEQRDATRNAVRAEASAQGSSAIVRIDRALARIEQTRREVEFAAERLKLRRGGSRSYRGDNTARSAGRAAGNNVRLGGSAGHVGRGSAGVLS
jgi:hypothetical protein